MFNVGTNLVNDLDVDRQGKIQGQHYTRRGRFTLMQPIRTWSQQFVALARMCKILATDLSFIPEAKSKVVILFSKQNYPGYHHFVIELYHHFDLVLGKILQSPQFFGLLTFTFVVKLKVGMSVQPLRGEESARIKLRIGVQHWLSSELTDRRTDGQYPLHAGATSTIVSL